ncbi:hypothetical protein O6H91_23G030900 [Diphasiastrum complanatum]|uniref:Uncharacterized protein n=1 Tax=Diphasiastrum complanatum TaxID=34168 RepID=A0ACC2A9K7_DIPCM|nr:hypothetical protein O6H91_23G030900 [Diphasiastrum complanatum]
MAVLCTLSSAFRGLSLSASPRASFFGSTHGFMACDNRTAASPSLTIEAAHKKGSGSTKNGRDSKGKRLGVKIYGDQAAQAGSIIIRQRGTKFHPGNNVGLGRDYTIFSKIDGVVKFEKFGPDKKKVSVYPKVEVPENPNSRKVRRREFYRARRERSQLVGVSDELNGLVIASTPTLQPSEIVIC